jgi:hypothetical protein
LGATEANGCASLAEACPPQPWREIPPGRPASDRQATETAIETFCREFCDPDGALSPRQTSPNPNIIFPVAANPNSSTDEIFFTTFVKHSGRNLNRRFGLGPTNPARSSAWLGELATLGLSVANTI